MAEIVFLSVVELSRDGLMGGLAISVWIGNDSRLDNEARHALC